MTTQMRLTAALASVAMLCGTPPLRAQHGGHHGGARHDHHGGHYRSPAYHGGHGKPSTVPTPSRPGKYPGKAAPSRPGGKAGAGKGAVTLKRRPGAVKAPGRGYVARKAYAKSFGTRLKSGYVAYRGLKHRHWSGRCYSRAWGCWLWLDPCTGGWYYWCGGRGYFLPVRYLSTCEPTTTEEDATENLPPESQDVPVSSIEEVPDLPEPN